MKCCSPGRGLKQRRVLYHPHRDFSTHQFEDKTGICFLPRVIGCSSLLLERLHGVCLAFASFSKACVYGEYLTHNCGGTLHDIPTTFEKWILQYSDSQNDQRSALQSDLCPSTRRLYSRSCCMISRGLMVFLMSVP